MTPDEVRGALLTKLLAGEQTISELGQHLDSLGVKHGYDTAYRYTMRLKGSGLVQQRGKQFELSKAGYEAMKEIRNEHL